MSALRVQRNTAFVYHTAAQKHVSNFVFLLHVDEVALNIAIWFLNRKGNVRDIHPVSGQWSPCTNN